MGSQDNWTEQEIQILKEEYPTGNTKELAVKLDKTVNQVNWKANYLGIRKKKLTSDKLRNWSNTEIEYIQNTYDYNNPNSLQEISLYLNRTEKAIIQKLSLLQIDLRPWTDEDIDYLIQNFEQEKRGNRAKIAKHLKKSIPQINQKIYSLGLITTCKKDCRLCKKEFFVGHNHLKEFCGNKCSYDFYILKRQIIFQNFLARFKLITGCCLCGYRKTWKAIDYHHINPDKKEKSISNLFGHIESEKGRTKLIIELNKCISVCRNCHVEIHNLLEENINYYDNLISNINIKIGDLFIIEWSKFEKEYTNEYLTKIIREKWVKNDFKNSSKESISISQT